MASRPAAVGRLLRGATRNARRYAAANPTERVEVRRSWFFRLATRYVDVLGLQTARGTRFISTADEIVSRSVFVTGGFDQEAMDRIMSTGDFDVRGRTVIDVGANIGTTSLDLAQTYGAATVVAIEPDEQNHRLLRINVVANDLERTITAVRSAVSNEVGELTMRRSPDNWGDHRITSGWPVDGETTRVPVTTLDALVDQGVIVPSDVGLVWVDVQGHEAQVLEGASKLHEAGVPFVIEYCPFAMDSASALDRLHDAISSSFSTVIDMGPPWLEQPATTLPAAEVGTLRAKYTGELFTDLILRV